MSNKIKITSDKLLAVEGKDECNFFAALLAHEKIKDIQIFDIGGKDKFKHELPLLLKMENFSEIIALGFIRDAEANQAMSAFQSICSLLNTYNLPAPQEIDSIADDQYRRVGIFIMPNNINEGMLEDLCFESVKDCPEFMCVKDYIKCCLAKKPKNNSNMNLSKAKIQTYLATQIPIVNSLGLAAQKGLWDFDNDCFSKIKTFLHNLYDDRKY